MIESGVVSLVAASIVNRSDRSQSGLTCHRSKLGRADGATVLGSDVLAENVRVARTLRLTSADLRGARLPSTLRVRFECRDIVGQGAPGTGWDVVLCRNVAIYLDAAHRRAVHDSLARAARTGGVVMLGRSERFGDPDAFGLRRVAPHIYRRVA